MTANYKMLADQLKEQMMGMDPAEVYFPDLQIDNSGRTQSFTVPFEQYLAWHKVHGEPWDGQRLHELRAEKNKLKHVTRGFVGTHSVLTLLYVMSEKKFKLSNGNGRTYLWTCPEQMLRRPNEVTLIIQFVETHDEGQINYECEDSAVSRKVIGEEIQGTLRRLDLLPYLNSVRIKQGLFKGVLSYLNKEQGRPDKDFDGCLEVYGEELVAVSNAMLPIIENRSKFPNLLLCVALILAKRKKVFMGDYIEALYNSINATDDAIPEVNEMLSQIAMEHLHITPSEAMKPGVLKGMLGKEGPLAKLTQPLVDRYESYQSLRAMLRHTSSRKSSRKAA